MPINALWDIYRVNLGVKKSERVLVFTDRPGRKEPLSDEERTRRERLQEIANLTADIGRSLVREVVYVEYPSGGIHGREPSARLWKAAFGERAISEMKDAGHLNSILRKKARPERLEEAEKIVRKHRKDAVNAVIALSHYSTTHTTFRDFLTRVIGARYASMPLFDFQMLEGPMNVDWKALDKRTKEIARVVNSAVTITITTPNGTQISLGAKGRRTHADTGILTKPGSFSNLPAGEAFLAPLEGTAEGTLVLDWAPTRRLASPVTLTVREGRVTEVTGNEDFAAHLRTKLSERPDNGNIAELGIGTNDLAARPDNILESEKILGTIHIALGDNSTFGGKVKTPFHQDFVFFKPTVVLKDSAGHSRTLLKDGRLRI